MMTGAFSQNISKLFSELKLVTDNLSIYAAANWEEKNKKCGLLVQDLTRNNLFLEDTSKL